LLGTVRVLRRDDALHHLRDGDRVRRGDDVARGDDRAVGVPAAGDEGDDEESGEKSMRARHGCAPFAGGLAAGAGAVADAVGARAVFAPRSGESISGGIGAVLAERTSKPISCIGG
jgi:hypothetical protein